MSSLISEARSYLCDLPVEQPRSDSVQAFVKQETIFVELTSDDGVSGTGYSYTIGNGGSAVLALLRDHLIPLLVGRNPHEPEAIWDALRRSTMATMVGPVTTLALAAIDTAVWDLRGKSLGSPLWRLAGGAQPSVALYDTEGGWLHFSLDELVANAVTAVENGFHGMKVKVGKPNASEDCARLQAVRQTLGPDLALMVDANQGFTRDEAVRRARAFERFDLAWLEEPLPADDVQGHSLLARSTSIPIAVGETLYSLAQFREYMTSNAASVLQPDVARIGGVTPWLKVAHLAEAFGVSVAPHFLMELHVSLAAAVPNGRWVEWIPQLRAVTTAPMETAGGRAVPSDAPGIGIAWNREAIDRLRTKT